jgi:2-aminoethylphosphonate-pyruvate transaminase
VILLNPGPVSLSPRVRRVLAEAEDLCHREPEFADLSREILNRLECVYEAVDDYTAITLTGSGTAAVEAMLSSFARKDQATLVVANGVYGERMAEMLQRQSKPFLMARSAWLEPIHLDLVAEMLRKHPEIACVAVVHHETTTGRLNDLAELARLCQAWGKELLIDAISSFGAEALPFAEWRPLAVAATANKCLHGIPGIACVLARRDVLEQNASQATSLYLDLMGYYRTQKSGYSPFTQAVQAAQALCEALRELANEGGWLARQRRYQDRTNRVRQALTECGVSPLLPTALSASMLTSYQLPTGFSYEALHRAMKASGFIIYAGQGEFNGRVFRIATMGEIGEEDLARLSAALRAFFKASPV